MEPQHPPLRRLSAGAFAPDDIDLIMRNSPRQFTAEEIAALAAFDLPDPDQAALQRFTTESANGAVASATRANCQAAPAAAAETHLADYLRANGTNDDEVERDKAGRISRPTTAQQRARGARLDSVHGAPPALPSPSAELHAQDEADPSRAVSAGRRPSQQLQQQHQQHRASASEALTGIDDTKRIFSILSRQDLVGGPETVAEAILSTRFVDLSDSALTGTASAECFLNATHVYLQHNLITDLDGLLLLAQLRVLVVHHNRLTSLTPLAVLDALMYLDACDNEVERLDAEWDLPRTSLQYLNLLGNPCCPVPASAVVEGIPDAAAADLPEVQRYRQAIEAACTQLEMLDEMSTVLAAATEDASEADEEGDDTTVVAPPAPAETVVAAAAARDVVPPSKPRPTKPATAPAGGPRRAPPKAASSSSRPRRVSEGVPSTKNAGAAATKSRPQRRLDQLRAEAERTRVGHDAPAQTDTPVTAPTAEEEDTAALAEVDSEGDGPSEALKKALQVKRASLTAGPTMSHDEERLLQQFQLWTRNRREAVLATLGEAEDEDADGMDDADKGVTSSTAERCPYTGSGEAAYMQSKVYLDVEFADKVARDRLERSLEDTWAGVAKVRQTRMAVMAERRRHQRETLKDHSKTYEDTLQLLKKEGFTENLEPYRAQGAPPSAT